MLDVSEVHAFVRDGFVALRGAVPADVIAECSRQVDDQLRALGLDPDDPATWTAPVVRLNHIASPASLAAGTQDRLVDACEQLLGSNSWQRPIGMGTIPVRFPHADDPGDAGWHVDGGFEHEGMYWSNLASRGRGLLVLFLISDVGVDDAPTELKVGSHLDLPAILAPAGDDGLDPFSISRAIPTSTFERVSALATGRAGDVYLCHPFLVHRATWPHRGTRPRSIAQPGVHTHRPFSLGRPAASPVEAAILAGLAGRQPA